MPVFDEPRIDFTMKLVLILLMPALLAAELVHGHEMKIASVDAGKIFSHWDYTISFEDKLERRRQAIKNENEERKAVINKLDEKQKKMVDQYTQQKESMSAEQKTQMDASYKNLVREIKALEQERLSHWDKEKRKLSELETKTSRFILENIQKAVTAYAEREQFDMVVDIQGQTTRNIPFFLHLDGAVDITDKIIAQLNETQTNALP